VRRLAVSILAACSVAACAASAASAAAPIKASGPVSDQVPKFQQAISDRSCDEVIPLLTTISSRPAGTTPGAPAQPGECDNLSKTFFDDWTGFQVNATRNFGTAALVTGEKDGVKEQVWNLDADGVYRYGFGIQSDSDDTTHKLIAKKSAIKSANALVVAIRKHDCKALVKLTNKSGPLYQGFSSDKAYCKVIFKGHFQKWLRQTPKAKPVFEGGTGAIAFFYVKTRHEVTTLQLNKDAIFTNRYYALNYTFNKGKI
jgi:hypothetical protein